ncbi:MAG TPA: hypothetical protein VFY97_09550 [Rhodanobacteraceae bacterium]|nr:hypothetical protein [Rhodanobacteraceae bacterium]
MNPNNTLQSTNRFCVPIAVPPLPCQTTDALECCLIVRLPLYRDFIRPKSRNSQYAGLTLYAHNLSLTFR